MYRHKCTACGHTDIERRFHCDNLPLAVYKLFQKIGKFHSTNSIYETQCKMIEAHGEFLFGDKYILRSEVEKEYILRSEVERDYVLRSATEQSTAPDPTQPLPIDEFAQFAAQSPTPSQSPKQAEASTPLPESAPSKPVTAQEEPPFTDKEKEHHALLIKFGGCTPEQADKEILESRRWVNKQREEEEERSKRLAQRNEEK